MPFGGAVGFGNFDVFVKGDFDGNGREVFELGNGACHDEPVHFGNALNFPILDVFVDGGDVLFVSKEGFTHQGTGKFRVLHLFVNGVKEFGLFVHVFLDVPEGFVDDAQYQFEIVVPINVLFLHGLEKKVVLDENFAEKIQQQLFVVCKSHFRAAHVLAVFLPSNEFVVKIKDGFRRIFPANQIVVDIETEFPVFLNDVENRVFYETHVGMEVFFGSNQVVTGCIDFQECFAPHFSEQQKGFVIEVGTFLHALQDVAFDLRKGSIFFFAVSVKQLQYFYSD